VVVARNDPFLNNLYPTTPTSSVEAFHARSISVELTDVVAKPVGIDGGSRSTPVTAKLVVNEFCAAKADAGLIMPPSTIATMMNPVYALNNLICFNVV
jgi:hypothetical protein